ncbi:hypothetical protein HYS00_00185 [Candidatus Microgenomates bacterium]|nr:hypothetical protein [Candidatus Microgenomates bacterium]
MTRLERHQQRDAQKRTLILAGIILAVVVFFLTVGIPLFVNLSSSAGKLFGGTTKDKESGDLQFSDVGINTIPDATNSASLVIGGTVANIDNLSVYVNGSVNKKLNVSGKSDYTTEIDGLKAGQNEIYVSGSLKGSADLHESQKYTVTFRNDKPKLEIESPTDNSSTPRDEIQVLGKTDAGTDLTVKINGSPTVLATGGVFQGTVKLKEGDNKITVTVSDSAGNTEEKSVNIKYEK